MSKYKAIYKSLISGMLIIHGEPVEFTDAQVKAVAACLADSSNCKLESARERWPYVVLESLHDGTYIGAAIFAGFVRIDGPEEGTI